MNMRDRKSDRVVLHFISKGDHEHDHHHGNYLNNVNLLCSC